MPQKIVAERNAKAPGYGGVAKGLHWVILALLVAQYTVAWTMPDIHAGTEPETLIDLHLSLGMTLLILAVIRLLWRWRYPVPLVSDNVPSWQERGAQATHWLLYLLIFALPILGWLAASGRDWNITFFGLFDFPRLMAPAPELAGTLGDYHTLLSYVLLGVVGLHVLAALYHHFWLRDRVLERMLPGKE